MKRNAFIELVRRQIYGGLVPDDAEITVGQVNALLEPAIGVAVKANYADNLKIESVGYVNGSFYTTFKGLAITQDEFALWKVVLPQLPYGLGRDDGISTLLIKDDDFGNLSQAVIWISQDQKAYYDSLRPIPNKLLAYQEGKNVFLLTALLLGSYTVSVTMVSGGDPTDLNSELNVPADYHPVMVKYLQEQLLLQRNQPVDSANDGVDQIKTT